MRGALIGKNNFGYGDGIIPAYAGSTARHDAHDRVARDHPRVCGEHPARPLCRRDIRGSSPRMRGALPHARRGRRRVRIIPAYAGSTWASPLASAGWSDHPRVCGEHASWSAVMVVWSGSSPRMRGAQVDGHRNAIEAMDHPRVCGEHGTDATARGARSGSSPRMRGAPSRPPFRFSTLGIIPAYAGSTCGKQCRRPGEPDHPRVCGEHGVETCLGNDEWGSSPRMRGALLRDP